MKIFFIFVITLFILKYKVRSDKVKNDSSTFDSVVPTPAPLKEKICGKRNPDGISFKITREHESEYGEFPWMIAVLKLETIQNEAFKIFLCGGSLIHPQIVLTAAHCVAKHNADDLVVRAGEWDRISPTEEEIYKEQNRQVFEILLHKDFNNKSLFNDIALLFTAEQFNLAPNINTVCLPPPDFNFNKNRCFSTGWGKDQYHGKYQAILKKIDVPVVPNDECQTKLQTTSLGKIFKLHESFICAGGEGQNTCEGDDGGPLSCPIPGLKDRFYQAGIVASHPIGCDGSSPDMYASIAFLRNWIDKIMAERGFDETYYTP